MLKKINISLLLVYQLSGLPRKDETSKTTVWIFYSLFITLKWIPVIFKVSFVMGTQLNLELRLKVARPFLIQFLLPTSHI